MVKEKLDDMLLLAILLAIQIGDSDSIAEYLRTGRCLNFKIVGAKFDWSTRYVFWSTGELVLVEVKSL